LTHSVATASKFPGVTRDNIKYWIGADLVTQIIAIYLEAEPRTMAYREIIPKYYGNILPPEEESSALQRNP
jgi:hypothetical protein